MRNVVALSRLDVGVDTTGLVSARVSLPPQRYRTVEDRRVFYRRLGERLAALPGMRAGITSATAAGRRPARCVGRGQDASGRVLNFP